MSSLDQAYATQLTNIQKKTGKSLDELARLIQSSGLKRSRKFSRLRKMLGSLPQADRVTIAFSR